MQVMKVAANAQYKYRLLYVGQSKPAATTKVLLPPSDALGKSALDSVILGDIPSRLFNKFFVPFVGLSPNFSTRCLLIAAPSHKYDGTESIETMHGICLNHEDDEVGSCEMYSSYGMFSLVSPRFPKGNYRLWVAVYESQRVTK